MHRPAIAVAALLAVGTLGACGAEQRAAKKPDTGTVAQAGTAAAAPNVVTVHAKDFAFDAPASVPAGMTTFHFVNDGPGFHHMQIVRLDSGKTLADLQAALKHPGPPPRWAVFTGGPNAPNPGGQSNVTLDLAPGNYAAICLVDIPGGVPHFAKGMTHAFTVTPSATQSGRAAAAPAADIQLTQLDYKFELSKPITAGQHTFEVHNGAMQPHEVELIKLAPGKSGKDFLDWMMKMQGPPPGSAVGGSVAAMGSTVQYFTADVTPGEYMLICFIPDAKDGKPHFMHGMMQEVKVS